MSTTQEIAPLSVAVVALDDAIQHVFDYEIPDIWRGKLHVGMRVKVPVRTTVRQGTVIELKETSPFPKLVKIREVLSEKVFLPPDLFQLAKAISHYYCTPLDKVIQIMLPASVRGKAKPKEQRFIQATLSPQALSELCVALRKTAPAQAEVLDVLLKFPKGLLFSKLIELTQGSESPVHSLIEKKILCCQKGKIDRSLLIHAEYFPTKPKTLNEEQAKALQAIQESLDAERFEVRLIHGVTGSGKTEVYLQAIDHALKRQKGVLFLVPEIALTSQMIEKLKGRFSEKIAILHHRLSLGERHDAWHRLRDGLAPIVIGARSSVFSPVANLGLIIVDEEHESSYKQSDDPPLYHARDVAIMRGKIAHATVLLGSATPSLESYKNASTGKYTLSTLHSRADHAHLPDIRIVDMQREWERSKGFTLFSELLLEGIKKRVAVGEQVLLFLNRRGYHTALFCPKCSEAIQCPLCSTNLTFHLGENILACHLCDYRLSPPPKSCPKCHTESIKFKGAGTEMVERALHAIFPEIRTLRLDADTTRHKGSHELLFKQFRAGKADVLIGTQMIAKGLHFPMVTLVGVLNADSSLQVPDFRASETVFQLLTQVAGRSGRGALRGEVLLQTHLPDHPIITLAQEQNYEAFYAQEIETRELFHYPPFTRLVKITFKGKDPRHPLEAAQALRNTLIQRLPPHYELLPVVPCGHAKVKEEYRFQFLIKAEGLGQLLPLLRELGTSANSLRALIDVDPTTTFF